MKKSLLILSVLLVFIFGCTYNPFIGVGNQVDTDPPIVAITSHSNFDYVSGNFTFAGTCFDNIAVTNAVLKIELAGSIVSEQKVVVSGNTWSVNIATDPTGAAGLKDGEYKFNIFVYDARGNSSKESYKTITLIIDNSPSVTEITYPILKAKSEGFETLDPYNYDNIEFFQNGSFYIQGWIEENYKVETVILQLKDESGALKEISFGEDLVVTVKDNGTVIDANGIFVEGTLWSWKIYFKTGTNIGPNDFQRDTKYYYTVTTTVKDSAKNSESITQGVVCLYQKADYPFTLFPSYGEAVPVSSTISGTSYDDDGINKVTVRILDNAGELVTEKIFDTAADSPKVYTWKVTTPEIGGGYSLEVTIDDKNGVNNKGVHDAKYEKAAFTTIDAGAPVISMNDLADSYNSVVDATGHFTVSGIATDNTQITKVYVAWVPTGVSTEFVNRRQWDCTEVVSGIKYYQLYNYEAGGEKIKSNTWSKVFDIYNDFNGEYKTKSIFVYAENISTKYTVTNVTIPKDETYPVFSDVLPEARSTVTTAGGSSFNISGKVSDYSRFSPNGKISVTLGSVTKEVVVGDGGAWSISSNEFDSFGAGGASTFILAAVDAYGNKTEKPHLLYIDNGYPYIKSVTQKKENAADDSYYKTGDAIYIALEITKAVTVTGVPSLSMNSGGSAKAVYDSGSGTSTLVFKYVVGAGDTTQRLDCLSMDMTGVTIKDTSGLSVDLGTNPLPTGAVSGSLSSNVVIVIDTMPPTLSNVKNQSANGAYKSGASIEFALNFSEIVVVTTQPTFKVNGTGVANYKEGSGSTKLVFTYTVGTTDTQGAVSYSEWGIINKIYDLSGNEYSFSDISIPPGLTIDTESPTITKITTTKDDGYYNAGKVIPIEVSFDEVVNVSGTPVLNVSSGSKASYSSGNGSNKLIFNYTVGAGEKTESLKATGSLSGGDITDVAGNSLIAALPSDNFTGKEIVIDTSAPSIQAAGTTSPVANKPAEGANPQIYTINTGVTITFSGLESGTYYRWVENGSEGGWSTDATAGSISKTFGAGCGEDFYSLYNIAVQLKDKAGNISLEGVAVPFIIDTAKPKFEKVTSTTSSGIYSSGGINVTLEFNKAVKVTSPLTVTLTGVRTVTIANTSTYSKTVSGTYTIALGDDTGADFLNATGISGTIQDELTNSLSSFTIPAGNNLSDSKEIKLDGVAPTISSITTTSSGWFSAGSVIPVNIVFSEEVFVTGTPTITLSNGAAASYSSGSGTTTLIFTYTVASGDTNTGTKSLSVSSISTGVKDIAGNSAPTSASEPAMSVGIDTHAPVKPATFITSPSPAVGTTFNTVDGVTITFSGLESGTYYRWVENGSEGGWSTDTTAGTISKTFGAGCGEDFYSLYNIAVQLKDTAGNISEKSSSVIFTIDTAKPKFEKVTSTTSSGIYSSGGINVTLEFNKAVKITSPLTVTLTGGRTVTIANTSTYSKTVSGTYTIALGDDTGADFLNATGISGTIQDELTNSLSSFTIPAGNNLSDSKEIKLDGVAPTISSITTDTVSGWYKSGSIITMKVNYSEAVQVVGTPTITLGNGAAASYSSGSGTTTLIFTYTVASGDTNTGTKSLSVSSISAGVKDIAGNSAPTSASEPAMSVGIDTQKPVSLTIGGVVNGTLYLNPITLTITGFENSCYYQLTENGTTGGWVDTGVTTSLPKTYGELVAEGNKETYSISIKQKDQAGNESDPKSVSFTIDKEQLIPEQFNSGSDSGTKKVGDNIKVGLTFNKAVKINENVIFTLNNGKTITIGTCTDKINYISGSYTVASGDPSFTENPLDVVSMTGKVEDGRGKILDLSTWADLTTTVGKLSSLKQIRIDTVSPTISSITTTSSGWFSAGSVIPVNIVFSEEVFVTGTPTITLSNGAAANYLSGSGTTTLIFTYTVASGNTNTGTKSLSVSSISAGVKDIAGNSAPTSASEPAMSVGIDTYAPSSLSIGGVSAGASYSDVSALYLSGFSSDTTAYSITVNGSGPGWTARSSTNNLAYSDFTASEKALFIVNSGTSQSINLRVKQKDRAGNISDEYSVVFTIDKTIPVFQKISSTKSSSSYNAGKTIDVSLTFSKPVKVTIAINVTLTNGKTVTIPTGTTYQDVLTCNYTVAGEVSEDTGSTYLNASSISGAVSDNIGNSLTLSSLPTRNLIDCQIKVDTKIPALTNQTASYSTAATITLTFSESISIVAGKKISLNRVAYAAPIILTESEYAEYYAQASGISTYYEKGVNGCTGSGYVSDNTTKYILKYAYEPTDTTLVGLFSGIGYYKQDIYMESTMVSVSGSTVTITIPSTDIMTGESYFVTLPQAGIIKDAVGNTNTEIKTSTFWLTFTSGNTPQKPVIRVNKKTTDYPNSDKAQTTKAKFSCVTSGATITYSGTYSGSGVSSGAEQTLGSADNTAGSFTISAYASKSGSSSGYAYEKAYKTVISSSPNGSDVLFFRGANVDCGSATIPNFPFSWDETKSPVYWSNRDSSAAGGMIRAMDNCVITWAVNTKLYFHGLSCKSGVSARFVWKWRTGSPISVSAGGSASDDKSFEASYHNTDGSNE